MSLLHIAGGATEDKLDVSDVFSTYLYTGNDSTQTINNGINLADEGGLVWTKSRTGAAEPNCLFDSDSSFSKLLQSNTTSSQLNLGVGGLTATTTGYTINNGNSSWNSSSRTYASWTFRKAPRFFDVVTWTGDGTNNRQIPHSLGVAPGMVICKSVSGISTWAVKHRSSPSNEGQLNSANAFDLYGNFPTSFSGFTDTYFTVNAGGSTNGNGTTYVAYLYAHDPLGASGDGSDSLIQCGSFTGNTAVNLGWEPQYIMYKRTDSTGNWIVLDSMRGIVTTGNDQELYPNLSNVETTSTSDYLTLTPTGFSTTNLTGTYIYMAIRRSMKEPTTSGEVFAIQGNNGATDGTANSNIYTSNFPIDMYMQGYRNGSGANSLVVTRLLSIGDRTLVTSNTNVEGTSSTARLDDMNGVYQTNTISANIGLCAWMWKRAKGFFDVVCYTGTSGDTVLKDKKHNLGRVPEMMIVKVRNNTLDWYVYHKDVGNTAHLILNSTSSKVTAPWTWENTTPTETSFHVSSDGTVNAVGYNYVAYLFASLHGISKVGSYTGNGSSQTINCGFSTGAKFVLIKRTDSTGDWYIWDSVRGIVAANDPHLSLNTTVAEVTTDDSIDPDTSGFIVNQNTATNINVNSGSYIYYAIAN